MPSTTWDNLTADKQDRIIQAAATEFGLNGFSSGSLNVIAKDAGVAKGSLFQYFEDKMELFEFVYANRAGATRNYMQARLQSSLEDTSLFGIWREILFDFIVFHRENPAEGAILRAMTFEPDPEVRAVLRHVVDRHYIELISLVVDVAKANGELREDADTDTLAAMIHLVFVHLGVAGVTPDLNPFIPVHELRDDDLKAAIARFVAPMEAFYGAPSADTR